VQASLDWLTESGAEFSPGVGRSGLAHLTHYTARYCVWGEGPPLVLVPGLAGGFELLGPLARLLAQDFQVISYQLRGEDDCFSLRRRFDRADLVADLREFLDWFGLERPPVLGVSFHLVESFNPGSRLSKVRVPTLLMAGDRDLLVSPESLRDLVHSLSDARRVDLPGCGHLAFVTQPDRVADEVKRFLVERDD
jgi:pimeloyl-ACP methyl ester carboxylesterase